MEKGRLVEKKRRLPLSRDDLERLKEAAEIGVLDIDYARWLERQILFWRVNSRPVDGALCCAFCFKRAAQVKHLVLGPASSICDSCILDGRVKKGKSKQPDQYTHCSFCFGKISAIRELAIEAGASICEECLNISYEMINSKT
jgi:hypothetical protein